MSFMGLLLGSSRVFTPVDLFKAGEQGVWYDPSDLTTLFQDSTGTTPVTAVEQPVGLLLDKSKNGVGTNGAKRVNILTRTEEFDNGAWPKNATTVTANATTAPNGTNTAYKLVETATNATHFIYQVVAVPSGTLTTTIYAKAAERSSIQLLFSGTAFTGSGQFNLSTGTATSVGAGTATITSVGDGWYRCSVTTTGASSETLQIRVFLVSSDNYVGNGTSGVFIWGADLRPNSEVNTSPTYQRIAADWPSSIAGNHATQSTSASRPVLSARVNLLEKTEQFDDAYWIKSTRVTVSSNQTTSPNGTLTADTLIETATTNTHLLASGLLSFTSGVSYTSSVYVKNAPNGRGFIQLAFFQFGPALANAYVNFDVVNGTVTQSANATGTITSVGDGWYRCVMTVTSNQTFSERLNIACIPSGTSPAFTSYAGDTSKSLYIWGADLRPTNDGVGLPVYQRVNTSTDYDTAGFPLYLRFDGTDDSLATGSINFTSTDKMTVWSGVRKLSDAATGIVAELSASSNSNSGVFTIFAPFSASVGNQIGFRSRGTASGDALTPGGGFAAPITVNMTGIGDITNDISILKLNASQISSSATDQGTGNFGNYPLYIGRRGGSSLPYNGRIYSLIVRGAQSTSQQITRAEFWVNSKTKAY